MKSRSLDPLGMPPRLADAARKRRNWGHSDDGRWARVERWV